MTTVLLIIHIIIAFAMVGIILIQKNEGGGLGMGSSGGAMGGLMSARGKANLLTRVTAVLATLFFVSTLGLAIVFKGGNKPKSILDIPLAAPVPGAPVPSPKQADSRPNVAASQREKDKKTVSETLPVDTHKETQ